MTINDMHPTELIEQRLKQEVANRNKIASDVKNRTEDLTYPNSNKDRRDSAASKAIRDYNSDRDVMRAGSVDAYYDDLMGEV